MHCQEVCEQLGVGFETLRVQVGVGASLENEARKARYAALAAGLVPGAILLMAQHRDDQAETLLFRLLRGAGVRGLSGMPSERPLGAGMLVRPLLGCGRGELEAYARQHGIDWLEDPSNRSVEHSRNFLRHQVMPVLEQRWPQATASIARAAGHCSEAQQLLGELAEMDLAEARMPPRCRWLPIPSLYLPALKVLSQPRQRNALRHWLSDFTALPDSDHWVGWEALRDAAGDAAPVWRLGTGELHRGDECLWWLSGTWLTQPVAIRVAAAPNLELQLPGNGSVRLHGVAGLSSLEVRYRQGGESMNLPARGRRDLKRLLNEARVPGFVRSRLPLLYRDDELIAVANLPQFNVCQVSLTWAAPVIPGLS